MRIDIHAVNLLIGPELQRYAQTHMWQAARRWARRVAWVGLWLVDHQDMLQTADLACRLDAWVIGVGVVTVRHRDTNPYVAIDIAAARLEQAIARKMGKLARSIPDERLTGESHNGERVRRQADDLAEVEAA